MANPGESSSVDLQSNSMMLERSMAMHGVPLSYLTDDQSFMRMLTGSSAPPPPPPQLLPSDQGNGGGGGLPEAIDRSFVAQTASLNLNTGEPSAKRKRGRPRKCGPDGLVLAPSPPSASLSTSGTINAPKRRGRPLGSVKKQRMVSQGSEELITDVHIVDVKEGEDVVEKILPYAQQGSQAICILSTIGVASKATLFHPSLSGGRIKTYEGCFQILTLRGSFRYPSDQQSLTGAVSASLSDENGSVFGGRIAGSLLAASNVEVILGSFIPCRLEFKETNATEVVPSLQLVSGRPNNMENSYSRAAFSAPLGEPRRNPPFQSTATYSDINSLLHPAPSGK